MLLLLSSTFLINICSAGCRTAALMDDPHHIFFAKATHVFFLLSPPMRHLQFILVPYLQCHKLLANSRKWFPEDVSNSPTVQL